MSKLQIKSGVVGLLVAALSSITVSAQNNAGGPAKRPSLVVGIVVEGLSTDYIDLLKNHFGTGGFRRLLEQGVTISDVDFGILLPFVFCHSPLWLQHACRNLLETNTNKN